MTHFLYPSLVQFCIPIVIFNSFFKLYLSEVSNYWGEKKSQPPFTFSGLYAVLFCNACYLHTQMNNQRVYFASI